MQTTVAAAAVLSLAISCATTTGSRVPGRVSVGDRSVSGAAFQPYTNLWSWSFTTAQGVVKPQGTWSDRLEIDSEKGRRIGRRTQEQRLPDGRKVVTVNVFDLETMAPLEREWRAFDGRFTVVHFNGEKLDRQMVRKPGAAEEAGRVVLAEPAFDFNGGMYGLLVRAFPLSIGYGAAFPAFSEEADKLETVRFVVRNRETVAGRGSAPVQAFRVEVATGNFGLMTFWLSDEAPYIIRLSFPMQGGTIDYQMI